MNFNYLLCINTPLKMKDEKTVSWSYLLYSKPHENDFIENF